MSAVDTNANDQQHITPYLYHIDILVVQAPSACENVTLVR